MRSTDTPPGSEAERWDRIQANMLNDLREQVRLGSLSPDQYSKAMAEIMVRIREHREQAELRDLWRWADELAASDPVYEDFATFVRRFILEKRREQGKFGPP